VYSQELSSVPVWRAASELCSLRPREGARELKISIDAVPSEGGVRVGVRDTGPGLSPEKLSRLFEPFYTTKSEGMGMGLSICRSIIEAHGGRLWAIPCEPGGALFQFTIPAD
jgi:signal transduction histidine kinase